MSTIVQHNTLQISFTCRGVIVMESGGGGGGDTPKFKSSLIVGGRVAPQSLKVVFSRAHFVPCLAYDSRPLHQSDEYLKPSRLCIMNVV